MHRDGGDGPACLSEALRLLDHGFVPVPASALGKRPLPKLTGKYFQDQLRDAQFHIDYWTKKPDTGLGLLLDGFLLIDPDIEPAVEAVEAWMSAHGIFCPMQLTPGGGRHYLVAIEQPLERKSGYSSRIERLDWKCGEHLIEMISPTVGKDGNSYRWAEGRSIYDLEPPLLSPEQVESLKADLGIGVHAEKQGSGVYVAGAQVADDGLVPIGDRHDELVSLSGALRRVNRSKDEARVMLKAFRDECCVSGAEIDHLVSDKEIEEILDWNFDAPPPPWLHSPYQNEFVHFAAKNSAEAVVLHCLINMADMRGRIETHGAKRATIRKLCRMNDGRCGKALKNLESRGRIQRTFRNNSFYEKKMKNEPTSTIYIIHYQDWTPDPHNDF